MESTLPPLSNFSSVPFVARALSSFPLSVPDRLTRLSLSRNSLKTFSFQSRSLQVLDVSLNQLESISLNCPKLTILDVSYNYFSDAESISFTRSKLSVFRCSGVFIDKLPSCLSNSKKLQFLDLSESAITSIRPLLHFRRLSTLLLRLCSCLEVDLSDLANFTNLKFVDLTYANITSFSPSGSQNNVSHLNLYKAFGFPLDHNLLNKFLPRTKIVYPNGRSNFNPSFLPLQTNFNNAPSFLLPAAPLLPPPLALSTLRSKLTDAGFSCPLTLHEDRFLGVFLGAAIGDSNGLATEFHIPSLAAWYTPYPSLLTFLLNNDHQRASYIPGHWTDDTSQAILIARTLSETRDISSIPSTFAAKLKHWCEYGFSELGDVNGVGTGREVKKVVSDSSFLSCPLETALRIRSLGLTSPQNGALMRTFPIGLTQPNDEVWVKEAARMFAMTTHPDPRAQVSCVIVSLLIARLMRGEEVKEVEELHQVVLEAIKFIDELNNGKLNVDHLDSFLSVDCFDDLDLGDSKDMGYTYRTLGASLLSLRKFLQGEVFEDLLGRLIVSGGDADTNCCVTGALLGGYLGFSGLSKELIARLPYYSFLIDEAARLWKSIKE
ncbi:hypothetical protein P9112_010188 [Eukaryota sp. TZLM1-RC]